MTRHVTIELTEAQAAVLDAEAARESTSVEAVVRDLIQRQVDYDEWFRAKVQEGIDAADRGELLSHEEVVKRARRRREELLGRKRSA